MEKQSKLFLSPSKIDCFNNCSWLYFCKYVLKIKEQSNTGAKRGTICHYILEFLLKARHKKRYDDIISRQSCRKVEPIWKLITIYAKKLDINTEEHLGLINDFILVGLNTGFFGPKGTKEILGEEHFEISVDEDGKRYSVRGIIDKTFVIHNETEQEIYIVDYKSSKAKFTADKLNDNLQSLIYQLALKKKYPDIKKRKFDFLFLKFPRVPIQSQPSFTDYQLNGLEYMLTEYQAKLESFTQKDATANLAAMDNERKWLCGGHGVKKDGSRKFICAFYKPFCYYKKIDSKGQLIQASISKSDLGIIKDNEMVEEAFYGGCSFYYNERGRPRNFQ